MYRIWMSNAISLSEGTQEKSSWNTYGNSVTTGTDYIRGISRVESLT